MLVIKNIIYLKLDLRFIKMFNTYYLQSVIVSINYILQRVFKRAIKLILYLEWYSTQKVNLSTSVYFFFLKCFWVSPCTTFSFWKFWKTQNEPTYQVLFTKTSTVTVAILPCNVQYPTLAIALWPKNFCDLLNTLEIIYR